MRIEYIIGDDILEIIGNQFYNLYNGKVDFKGPNPERAVVIKTGLAGMLQVSKLIKVDKNTLINSIEHTFPFLVNVKFVLDTSIDKGITATNTINGFRQSSYSYNIYDESTGETIEIAASGVRELQGVKKYYWSIFRDYFHEKVFTKQSVTTDHPFYRKTNYIVIEDDGEHAYCLLNWKEITKEEFDLFNKIHSK